VIAANLAEPIAHTLTSGEAAFACPRRDRLRRSPRWFGAVAGFLNLDEYGDGDDENDRAGDDCCCS